MGRAMLIICAGVLVSLGFIGIGTQNQGKMLIQKSAGYAEIAHAKNAAYTAIEIAMNEINKDTTFMGNHNSPSKAWTKTIAGAYCSLYVDRFYKASSIFDADSLRLISTADYLDQKDVQVISVYSREAYQDYVNMMNSPLNIAAKNYSLSASGSVKISGVDPSGECTENQATDSPAITISEDDSVKRTQFQLELADIETETGSDDATVESDTSLSYNPTDELIARLKKTDGVQYLSGNYKGSMGSKDQPGVFFVESPTKLTGGIDEGYGILVIRDGGEMSYDSAGVELSVAGNFKFNGLVVFENAYNFKGRGTPTINGSVLVGTTEDQENRKIDISLGGNLTLQYDCRGQKYAKMAAQLAIKTKKYNRVVTYE